MIPKHLFAVWVGGKPIPHRALCNLDIWRELHPDWQFTLYTDDNLPAIHNDDLYEAQTAEGCKSDIIRYEALRTHGGVYIDIDMEPRRCLDPLIKDCEAFFGRHVPVPVFGRTHQINTGIMGARPYHPLWDHIVNDMASWASAHEGESVVMTLGPLFIESMLASWVWKWIVRNPDSPIPPVTIFEPSVFYPHTWLESALDAAHYPDAYAIHRWWGTWHQSAPE